MASTRRGLAAAAVLLTLGASAVASQACRGVADSVKPAPEGDARGREAGPVVPPAPACLRLSSCGEWLGCVVARPQSLPFTMRASEAPITKGTWYRFDLDDRRDEVGSQQAICVGLPHPGRPCFEALQHVVPCLPYFNPVVPDYRCEALAGACTKVAEGAPAK